jgi:asparagine synthase (glutamine-hydrolysing)
LPVVSKEIKAFEKQIVYKNFTFRYLKFDKFAEDKIFIETKNYIIGIDGVILNLQKLKKHYAISDFAQLIISLFKKESIGFVSKLKGEFSGFIFEKEVQNLVFFNNKTATKQVFYSLFKDVLVIAPTLLSITEVREKVGVSNNLNIQATYNFLTFGAMIQNQTLVDEIYKLGGGEYLAFKNNELKNARYFDFNEIEITINTKKEAIEKINESFVNAVSLEYQKDEEYHYNLIATLSGGLDSRINVMLADKMGYKPTTFCFSQSNYADEIIARKISKDLGLDLLFVPLDGGDYLKNLSKMTALNSGLQYYHAAAHYDYALQQIDLSGFGLMHTGQIGDGILGGFVSKGTTKNYLSKTVSTRFLNKVTIDKSILNSYRDEEVFKLYQRVFNLTNFGSYVVEQHQTYLVSPFFDDEVIQVALSIDPKLKTNQDIYIDWMNHFHPQVTKYTWERTGFKPDKKWKTAFSRYTNKIKKEYHLFTNQKDKLSMNPIDYWMESNLSIQNYQDRFFAKHKHLLTADKDLYKDIDLLYQTGVFIEKAIVLTLLELINQLKLKV